MEPSLEIKFAALRVARLSRLARMKIIRKLPIDAREKFLSIVSQARTIGAEHIDVETLISRIKSADFISSRPEPVPHSKWATVSEHIKYCTKDGTGQLLYSFLEKLSKNQAQQIK